MIKLDDYPFEIRPLKAGEGGGYLISYLDFSERIADGETVEEAILQGREALVSTIAALEAKGFAVPAPNSGGAASGKFVARIPKTIHTQLATRAKSEGGIHQYAGADLHCGGSGEARAPGLSGLPMTS